MMLVRRAVQNWSGFNLYC